VVSDIEWGSNRREVYSKGMEKRDRRCNLPPITKENPELATQGKEDTAMRKKSARERDASRVEWENLEEWVRGHVQHFIQDGLEDEVQSFWGEASRSVVEQWMGHQAIATGTASRDS